MARKGYRNRRRQYLLVPTLVVLLLFLVGGFAYTQAVRPLVGFVVTRALNASSVADLGVDGVSRLGQMFRDLGANVQIIRLNEEIPADMKVVVLVRPQRRLSSDMTARLYQHLQRGNHLLLAVDPNSFARVNAERRNDGLNKLIAYHYGISFEDSLLVEPWTSITALDSLANSQSSVQSEDVLPNAILDPLLQYELPVQTWAARNLTVDAITAYPGGGAVPLLYTDMGYAETSQKLFVQTSPDPLELNIGKDYIGRLWVGAVGVNQETGSRVVVLGDSEMVQNIYGLSYLAANDEQIPRYPGNTLLSQRLAAWLLEMPQDEWPDLSDTFTHIVMDGDGGDWDRSLPVTDGPEGSQITQVRVQHNDQFMYVLAELNAPPPDDLSLRIAVTVNDQRQTIRLDGDQAVLESDQADPLPIPDAAVAVGPSAIEIRLPLRVVSISPVIRQLCLIAGESIDCVAQRIISHAVATLDPVSVRFPPGPTATVYSAQRINMRSAPTEDSSIVQVLDNGTPFAAVGRDETGAWINVQNGRYDGWIATGLLSLNTEPSFLPVVFQVE